MTISWLGGFSERSKKRIDVRESELLPSIPILLQMFNSKMNCQAKLLHSCASSHHLEMHQNQEINRKSEAIEKMKVSDSDHEQIHETLREGTVDKAVGMVQMADQTLHVSMIVVVQNRRIRRRVSGESGAPKRRSG